MEQFLEAIKDKMCCIESPDTDVISVNMRGCKVSSAYGGLDFENVLDTFEIEEEEIDSIHMESANEFYIDFGNVFAVTVSLQSLYRRKRFEGKHHNRKMQSYSY